MRNGGKILIDGLVNYGVETAFCVAGESFLAALDAMYDHRDHFRLISCRQEGGVAYMAEAWGKLTGRPGICFVSRGPGASNAMVGIHTAFQDSTPLICFVGQVPRSDRGRESFQELDYHRVYNGVAKKVISIDDARRIPEHLNHAWHTAISGRPGPVIVVLYEDMLRDEVEAADIPPSVDTGRYAPGPPSEAIDKVIDLLNRSERPLIICGDSSWNEKTASLLNEIAEHFQIPVAAAFRRQDSFDNTHVNYIGELGLMLSPSLREYLPSADLLLVIGPRLGEKTTRGYELICPPLGHSGQKLIHVHPGAEEVNAVFHADIAITSTSEAFLSALRPPSVRAEWSSQTGTAPKDAKPASLLPDSSAGAGRQEIIRSLHDGYQRWVEEPVSEGKTVRMDRICSHIRRRLPPEAIVTTGAGNYTTWSGRFYQFRQAGTQLGSTNGTMGYSVPAAVAAKLHRPEVPVISFNGDGCFLMNGQEFATAVQYGLPIVFLVINNSSLGTIRMHQEQDYPGRIIGTTLRNPDFALLARAYGGIGFTVRETDEFMPAFESALEAEVPSIIEIWVD